MNLNFQEIVNKLSDILPAGWNSAIFMAEYTLGSYSMRCYVASEDGNYREISQIAGASKAQIVKTYKAINNDIQRCRAELEGEACWYSMTIRVDKNGKFKTEFDYNSHEENVLDYLETWENKYLP